MRIGSIIEARMSSTRLPGKVLLKVKNKTILDHLVKRIKLVNKINKIIVATTKNEIDKRIVNWCRNKKINYFRGSEKNVFRESLFYCQRIQARCNCFNYWRLSHNRS